MAVIEPRNPHHYWLKDRAMGAAFKTLVKIVGTACVAAIPFIMTQIGQGLANEIMRSNAKA
ncbi:MAG: hypothetical protein JHD15_00760 [Phenylobacterium sp.]|uniref:hypothetical protein n=1 Tax=Phenylobacterium sp. TaxID=1871053 RepID=UPI001A25BFA6|nr:hypothetical protein [Phenylobacterium sp.]MBJ7408887.1 hypothetical protein [Phenylobacterium sp.]